MTGFLSNVLRRGFQTIGFSLCELMCTLLNERRTVVVTMTWNVLQWDREMEPAAGERCGIWSTNLK